MKHEIICIKRTGFSMLHTEGLDFAAKVTELLDHEVKQEWLIPLAPEIEPICLLCGSKSNAEHSHFTTDDGLVVPC